MTEGGDGLIRCAACGLVESPEQDGWRAYRADTPGTGEPPAVVFYCRGCAEEQFGPRRRTDRASG